MRRILNGQKGAVLITFAILLTALLGFVALGMEVGRWYLVRAELSKGVDAAAFAGAINVAADYVSSWGHSNDPFWKEIAEEMGKENFPTTGYLGTEPGSVSFSVTKTFVPGNKTVTVKGLANALAILAQRFVGETVEVPSTGTARLNEIEIMMVLDNSGSMAVTKMNDLITAANTFLDFFKDDTDPQDKMGLITFHTGVQTPVPMKSGFYSDMKLAISSMSIPPATHTEAYYTNMEDAVAQAAGGFTPNPGSGVKQFLIFFTDGMPDAFRGIFTRNGKPYDAVVYAAFNSGICDGYCRGSITRDLCDPTTGYYLLDGGSKVRVMEGTSPNRVTSGDGKPPAASKCGVLNTKWGVFSAYPVSGHGPEDCNIPEDDPVGVTRGLRSPISCGPNWFRDTAKKMALDHAQALKDRNITIFVIGLGNRGDPCNPTPEIPYLCNPTIDKVFLGQIASRPEYEYDTPNSNQLNDLFKRVAKQIRLQLIK